MPQRPDVNGDASGSSHFHRDGVDILRHAPQGRTSRSCQGFCDKRDAEKWLADIDPHGTIFEYDVLGRPYFRPAN